MIRQAQTYLVSAMSGATLIAIAIVGFVLLVSVQVFRDWPIAALGGNDGPHISDSRAISTPPAATATTASQTANAAVRAPGRNATGPGSGGAAQTQVSEGGQAPSAGPTATTSPVGSPETGSDGNQGSQPGSSPATQSPSKSGGSGTGSASSGGNSGSGSNTSATPTAKLTETVNETVNQADETATGGALGKTGVTEATEGVVNGVVGPESPVGKVVDGTVETVTGLLGGKK
jgi:hypothetical protein